MVWGEGAGPTVVRVVTARIEDLADASFDPYLSDELVFGDLVDPYPRIAELRAEAPVHGG